MSRSLSRTTPTKKDSIGEKHKLHGIPEYNVNTDTDVWFREVLKKAKELKPIVTNPDNPFSSKNRLETDANNQKNRESRKKAKETISRLIRKRKERKLQEQLTNSKPKSYKDKQETETPIETKSIGYTKRSRTGGKGKKKTRSKKSYKHNSI